MAGGDRDVRLAHQVIENSQADHLINKQFVLQMLNEHRDGVVDNSRRLWNVLVFMVWHGIFVEQSIVPLIEGPHLPGAALTAAPLR